jgi:hypothetical protein
MSRQRKIDEDLWEDTEETLSSDHVVERFFSQHEREAAHEGTRKVRPGARTRRRVPVASDSDE